MLIPRNDMPENNRQFPESDAESIKNAQQFSEMKVQQLQAKVCYAGFFVRLAANCIDNLIVAVLLLAVRFPMWISLFSGSSPFNTQVLFEFTTWDIIIYLLTSFYYIFLTYYSGATIGKKLFRIRVISKDGEKLSFMDILYRETIGKFLCTVAMNMGYILIGLDKEKRGFHDMLSDTRVIYDLETEGKRKKETTVIQASNYGYVSGSQKNAVENQMERD